MDNREGRVRSRGAPVARGVLSVLAGVCAGAVVSIFGDGPPSVLVSVWVACSIPSSMIAGAVLSE